MKKRFFMVLALASFGLNAQTNTELTKHFEAYYKQMKEHGDVQGVINALTHLDVLKPTQSRKDTLAYIYVSEGRYMEALNTIGIDKNQNDSNLNTEVKAIALKAINQPQRALEHYEVLFAKEPNPYLAYEIADLKMQVQDLAGAKTSVEYGLANATDDMKRTYYESQPPYQASLKAGFLYLKGILVFNENKDENVESALALLNHALVVDPSFKLAQLAKDALLSRQPKS
ncbi:MULTISPECIES: M48 family metallopeptidase [Mangrovimonas]|uniref:tetratricopeptide repeat protein n=1 Tax=Mangrovimonas TaxID=1211036 RepID=UPI0006B466FF|nr:MULTISPECIES: hypothetical protein [Mangrovimonas]OMP32469.1 hypothetical protein BKM32_05335 [Mangrovimonas sp. DI 80]